MKRIISLILFIIILSPNNLHASAEDKTTMIGRRVAETVMMLNDYIQFMADKHKSLSKRKYYRDKALSLFIEQGNAYEENGVLKNGAMIETFSRYRKKPTRRLVRDYFTGLMNLKYSKVSVTSAQFANIELSNLEKIAETEDGTLYACRCYVDQDFIGYRDGVAAYRDITRRIVTFRIVISDFNDLEHCIVLLGDITAIAS